MIFEAQTKLISLAELLPLRHQVLRPFATIDECENPGDSDPTTFHVGVFIGPRLVSIATFVNEGRDDFLYGQAYRLRGMATDDAYQKQGCGALALSWGLDRLRKQHTDFVWCKARVKAFSFYERMGFVFWGEFFDIPKIGPHKIMYRRLL